MSSTERRRKIYGGRTEPYVKVWKDGRAVRLHKLVAEQKLGRKLEPGEVVHHIEGKDDVPGNLEVYRSHSEHMVAEHYQRRERSGKQHLWSLEEWLRLSKVQPE
jgi:hypothetical protein